MWTSLSSRGQVAQSVVLCHIDVCYCIFASLFFFWSHFFVEWRQWGTGSWQDFVCWMPYSLKPALRGWCYKTISVSALCNCIHKPAWGFGMFYTFVHYVRASLLAVLISYVAGSYPLPCEAVIAKCWVLNRTIAYFSSRENFVDCTCSLSLWGPQFGTKADRVGFMVDRVALRQVLLWALRCFFRSGSSLQCSILVFL